MTERAAPPWKNTLLLAASSVLTRADTSSPIHDLLRRRWSPRAFADKTVDPETLLSLFEAARWAPSSNNAQPWSFIVATKQDPAEFARLLGCLVKSRASSTMVSPRQLLDCLHDLLFESHNLAAELGIIKDSRCLPSCMSVRTGLDIL